MDSVFYMHPWEEINAKLQLYSFHSPGSFTTNSLLPSWLSLSPMCGSSLLCFFYSTSLFHAIMFLEVTLFHSVWRPLDLSLIKVKWTPSAGNTLLLSKGNGWQKGLHWKTEIYGFLQMTVKYIIHRERLSKSDVLHTFWEQDREITSAECFCVSM